jgi:protein TonB
VTLWVRLLARLGQVEARQWVAVGASALLHVAVVLGLRQAPPPLPETVSFEIALQLPEAEKIPRPKPKSSQAKQADRNKRKHLAKAKKVKPKVEVREAHTLDAELKPEARPRKDAPAVSLPQAEALVAEAPRTLPQVPHEQVSPVAGAQPGLATTATATATATASAPSATAKASTASPAATEPGAAAMVAGGTAAPSDETGLALAAARNMVLAPGGGDTTQGAEASNNPGSDAQGANAGAGPATFSASSSVGGGLNQTSGSGANVNSASASTPLAGGEPQGLRLTASGVLSSLPEFVQGKGGLASGHLAQEAGAASPVDGQGQGHALVSALAGGASISPVQGPAAGPGKGSQGVAIDRVASQRQGGGPAPDRLAGAPTSGKSLRGEGRGPKRGGNSSQASETLALAPGEPGSGPGWAIIMMPVQVGVPMVPLVWTQGRGPGNQGGQARHKVATAPSGGDAVSGGGGAGPVRLAQARTGMLTSVSPQGAMGRGAGDGGRGAAPVAGRTTPGGGAQDGNANVMSSIKPAEQKLIRPDSRVETLDVLAPSNYCPLPIHFQPDNRPPQAPPDRVELPSYGANNPSFVYPVMANIYGVEGKLIMRVQVLSDGRPGEMLLKQSSGNGILDKDAREQLARWRYNPARKNGQTVTSWIDVPVIYRLSEGRK